MCSSIFKRNKFSLPRIQRRLSTLKKLNWKFKLLIALPICVIILTYLLLNKRKASQLTSDLSDGLEEFSENEIIILQWTSMWGYVYPTILFNSDNCSILKTGTFQQPPITVPLFDKPCRITYDQRHLNESHAVVFHQSDLFYTRPYSDFPNTTRAQNQIWIWYETEAPLHGGGRMKTNQNIFNWTMTYRRDSDVYYPYGYIFPRNISNSSQPSALDYPPDPDHQKLLQMKSGLAAWIVSTCITPSNREYFVNELQKYIPVDIFGKCGQTPCPQLQDKGYSDCYDYIQSKYKFYLSFENSLCLDYITEKLYLALQSDMVPVVYGGGIDDQMDYLAVAPKNSFIDARKFKSPQDLANYLIYLDGHDDEYLKYFEWKDKYQVVYKAYGQHGLGWCNLCQKVYDQIQKEEHLWTKWYSDLVTWWNYTLVLNTNAQLPLDSQSKLAVSPIGQSFLFSGDKVKSTCVPARTKNNFTSYGKYHKFT